MPNAENRQLPPPREKSPQDTASGREAQTPSSPSPQNSAGNNAEKKIGAEMISDLILLRRPVFLQNRRLDLQKMRAACITRDFDLVRKIGHNCKGIGSGYGFPRISELGAALSKAAKAADDAGLQLVLADFEECLLHAAAEIKLPESSPLPPSESV